VKTFLTLVILNQYCQTVVRKCKAGADNPKPSWSLLMVCKQCQNCYAVYAVKVEWFSMSIYDRLSYSGIITYYNETTFQDFYTFLAWGALKHETPF